MFNDPVSFFFQSIIDLHNYIMGFLVFIFLFVLWFVVVYKVDATYNFHNIYELKKKQKFLKKNIFSNHLKISNIFVVKSKNTYVLRTNRILKSSFLEYYSYFFFKKNLYLYFFNNLKGYHKIELYWTILPTVILCFLAYPSLCILYSFEDTSLTPIVSLIVFGNQWYWTYQINGFNIDEGFWAHLDFSDIINEGVSDPVTSNICLLFDSYMINTDELVYGSYRLLEVDNRVILPYNCDIRIIVTSTDVLHSWAVPSLGIKLDAIPGRLNQVFTFIRKLGVFYGQCSELCGVNHGFMPIVIETVTLLEFFDIYTVIDYSIDLTYKVKSEPWPNYIVPEMLAFYAFFFGSLF